MGPALERVEKAGQGELMAQVARYALESKLVERVRGAHAQAQALKASAGQGEAITQGYNH